MADRKPIKQAHERAQVAIFLQWLNTRYRTNFSVVDEPDPPEAIIRSGCSTRWVEVTDAFWSDAFAKDEYSYATPDEVHKSIGTGPFLNPDDEFSKRFVDAVQKNWRKNPTKKVGTCMVRVTWLYQSCIHYSMPIPSA